MSTKPDHVLGKGRNGVDSEDKEIDVSSRGGNSCSAGNHSLVLAPTESENSKEGSKRGGKSGGEGSEHQRSRSSSIDWVKQPVLPPQMTTKMKGLLKGLRYISQIFEPNAKEQEMQIGYPTDVKHVAHIGWDGPSVNSPSWMNEFGSRPDFSSAPLNTTGEAKEKPSSNVQHSGGSPESLSRSLPEKPKPARSSRRNHSSSGSVESPGRESSSDTRSKPRQQQQPSKSGAESPTKDSPGLPKQSRHRKTKGSRSTGGSLRSSRSKPSEFSDSDIKNVENPPALKSRVEEET